MSGRNRASRLHEMRGFRDGPYPHPAPRGGGVGRPVPVPTHPIQEEIMMRREECRRIHVNNRLMLEEITFLKRENAAVGEKRRFISEVRVSLLFNTLLLRISC
jgi:hypothetical protein